MQDILKKIQKLKLDYEQTTKGIKIFVYSTTPEDVFKAFRLSKSTIWRAKKRGYFYANYHVVKIDKLDKNKVPKDVLLNIYNFSFYKAIATLYGKGVEPEIVSLLKDDLAHEAYVYFLQKAGRLYKETEGVLERFRKISFETISKKIRALLRDNRYYSRYILPAYYKNLERKASW